MASMTFTPVHSDTNNMRFSARLDRMGHGLLRRRMATTSEMGELRPLAPRVWPDANADIRTPFLKGDGPGPFANGGGCGKNCL
jgi:hypothetical protein